MNYIRFLFLNSILISASMALISCGGGSSSSSTPPSATTRVQVFDGPAIGCTVTTEDATATEVGSTEPGVYIFAGVLDVGTVVTATDCTDADTNASLPELAGVVQTGGVIVSPITTLIVNAAESTASPKPAEFARRTISESTLEQITSQIVASLGIAGYDPLDPATANYVEQAKADASGSSVAATVMKSALAVSTLLKAVEVSAGGNAAEAVSAVANAFANSSSPVDLASSTGVQNLLNQAAGNNSALAAAINVASTAVSQSVAAIRNATGPVRIAIAATTTVVGILNTAQAETLADTGTISDLNIAVQQAIEEETILAGAPDCVLGSGVLGNCKI